MLDAGRAPAYLHGLIVFFDHADEDLRYIVPETPSIVLDPDPRLSLLLYRSGEGGSGGLLQLESSLAPTETQLEAVERDLASAGRTPTLARPDWRSGTVRVVGWLDEGELAPIALAVGPPSLVGDPLVVLAAHLDQAGAALADRALRDDSLPTALIFELETIGLSGPLGVEVEADLQAVHDRLTAEGALTTPYGRARLAKTWEALERENLIRVRVVDESGDVESRRAEAMRRVGEDLIASMFSPFPPPEKPAALDDEAVAAIELSFKLTMRREEVSHTSRWAFHERRAVPVKHYAAASLVGLLGGMPPTDRIHHVDLEPETREIVVRVEPELAALGILSLEVDLTRATEDGIEQTVLLTDEIPERRIVLVERNDETLMYRARARFDPLVTRAEDRESGWVGTLGNLVVVSARRLFPPRAFTVIAGRVELDWLDSVEVIVTPPEELERTLVLDASTRSADLFLPAAGAGPLIVTTRWRGLPGEPTHSDPPRLVDDDLLVLDSPFGDSIRILAVPLPLSDTISIVVELRYVHDGYSHEKTLTWEGDDRAPKRAGLRRPVGSPRSYEYRVIVLRRDGTLDEGPWISTEEVTLAVGAQEAVRVHETELAVLGGGPAGRGSLAIEAVLEAGTHQVRQLLEGEADHARLVLVAPEEAPAPALVVREFLMTGAIEETRWESPESLVVLTPMPVEDP